MLRDMNIDMSRKKIALSIGIGLLVLYMGMLIYQTYLGTTFPYVHYLVFPLLFGMAYIASYYCYSFNFFYLLTFAIVGLYFIFIPFYSPIDEGAHFDIILHIAQTGSLSTLFDTINSSLLAQVTGNNVPGGPQYEATHPPIYYLLGALIILPFKSNILVSFFVLRILDVLILIASFFVTMRIYSTLIVKKDFIEKPNVFMFLFLAFFMNPAFITRMITLSNESLVVLLFCLLFYFIVKFENISFGKKHIFILALLSALLLLTKFTTIYVLGLIVVAFVLFNQIKKIPLYIVLTGLISSPWFIYNYTKYGSLTGNSIHAEYVRKMVNPQHTSMGFEYIMQKISYFLGSFWNPQESAYPNLKEPFNFMTATLNNMLFYVILFNIAYVIYMYIKYKKIEKLLVLSLISIMLNVAVILYGTWSESIDILIGRYLYMNIIPLTIIVYFFLKQIVQTKYRIYCAIAIFMLTVFLMINQLFAFMQAPYNLMERAKTYSLITHINAANYSDGAYKQYVSKQNLSIIPKYLTIDSAKVQKSDDTVLSKKPKPHDLKSANDYYTVIGQDPYLIWSLTNTHGTTLQDFISLDLKYNNNTSEQNRTAQLFWDDGSGFNEQRSIFFNVTDSQVYNIPIGQNQQWIDAGKVKAIRLDIDTTDQAVSFHLNAIQIFKIQ